MPNTLFFNLSRRITKFPIPMVKRVKDAEEELSSGVWNEDDAEDKERSLNLLSELFDIDGVESVGVDRQRVVIEKAYLVEWEPGFLTKLKETLGLCLCPDEEFTPAGSPTRISYDSMGVYREEPVSDPRLVV